VIATASTVAPMFGFLGTVSGMMNAFAAIAAGNRYSLAVATAGRAPVVARDGAAQSVGRNFDGAVVLQPAVDVVGLLHIHADGEILREREVVEDIPCLGKIVGNGQTAVAAENQVIGIARVDPEA
jgi:hypothetical protein